MVCARRLVGSGAIVQVVLSRAREAFATVPGHQLSILHKMGVPCSVAGEYDGPAAVDLVVDGLIGYSLEGSPRGTAADLIRWANQQDSPVLSLDVPSGIDAGSGEVFDPAVRATATLTLALPKNGLRAAGDSVGELYLADIGVPPSLFASPSLALPPVGPIFATGEIVRLK